jgi:hypothetical protein
VNGFEFRVFQSSNDGYLALAKRGQFKSATRRECIREAGDVWFHYAPTANQALSELRQEVLEHENLHRSSRGMG